MTRTFTSDTGTFPSFCFGAGVFSGAYNAISKEDAYAAVRRALDRGVRLFDTAPYYGDSEIILGEALRRVASVYPRSSYQLSTKIGRYGLKRTDFDYSAARIRASIKQSLARLGTNYLDVVFCHDVEFVTPEQVLDEALPTLYELKAQGVIRHVGISGYPLDVLLRIAEAQAARGRPLDVVLSYCHYTLQSTRLVDYAPALRAAGVKWLMNASPLSMGLFRDSDPPLWHPLYKELRSVIAECAQMCRERGYRIADLALQYAMSYTGADTIVVGCCTPAEIDCALDQFRLIRKTDAYAAPENEISDTAVANTHTTLVLEDIDLVNQILAKLGPYHNHVWPSPPPDA